MKPDRSSVIALIVGTVALVAGMAGAANAGVRQTTLTVAGTDQGLGSAVAASGGILVAGAPSADRGACADEGEVYVSNRDERRWIDPTRFDIRRERAAEHLAFGFGPHACVGSNPARLELRVILEALSRRVKRFEIGEPVRALNQTLRGLAAMRVTVLET